jgi:hypothetical protein
VESHIATEVAVERSRPRRSARALTVLSLGPLTFAAGLAWAFLQPYRVTLLHPHGQGFWFLAVEPPLLVMLAALVFHLFVAPGVVDDLEETDPPHVPGPLPASDQTRARSAASSGVRLGGAGLSPVYPDASTECRERPGV